MKIIKNQTPYIGKLKLKFERNPHYVKGGTTDLLNKIHLNLGFTKLVSRMIPDREPSMEKTFGDIPKVDLEKIKLINDHTGGIISKYTFGPNGEYLLENSFLTKDFTLYIGDIERAWWYYKNKIIVSNNSGVAWKVYDTNKPENEWHAPNNIQGVYGYSHRGGQLFKIGDKIFESFWTPNEQDLFDLQKYYAKHLKEFDKNYSNHMSMNEWATRYIPFKLRGSRVIKDWDDAREAAINFSKYIG